MSSHQMLEEEFSIQDYQELLEEKEEELQEITQGLHNLNELIQQLETTISEKDIQIKELQHKHEIEIQRHTEMKEMREQLNEKEKIILSLKLELSGKEEELDYFEKNNGKTRIDSLLIQLERTEKEYYENKCAVAIMKNKLLGKDDIIKDLKNVKTVLEKDIELFYENHIDLQNEIQIIKTQNDDILKQIQMQKRRPRFM